MSKCAFLLLLLVLLPVASASANPKITRMAVVGDEFFVGVSGSHFDSGFVSVFFPDLGSRYVSASFDVSGRSVLKRISLAGMLKGDYYARVTVSNGRLHTTKYRLVSVE